MYSYEKVLSKLFLKNCHLTLKLGGYQVWRNFFWKRKTYGSYDVVVPWKRNDSLIVPDYIERPNYSQCGLPSLRAAVPEKLSHSKLLAMKRTCKLAANILKSLKNFIQIGVTTEDIDTEVHRLCIENDAYPSPLNYNYFPKSCCTSINNVACHGIPDSRPLIDGDIINVDVTVFREGVHGDCSTMFLVGNVDEHARKLCSVAKKALDEAVAICKPGVSYCVIGSVIENLVRAHNLSVIPCFNGHGIGSYFHGPPEIYHFDYKDANQDDKMEEGVCFTIEPVVGDGGQDITILTDDWTAVTDDNSRTAQYEYTLLITNDGAEILTPHLD